MRRDTDGAVCLIHCVDGGAPVRLVSGAPLAGRHGFVGHSSDGRGLLHGVNDARLAVAGAGAGAAARRAAAATTRALLEEASSADEAVALARKRMAGGAEGTVLWLADGDVARRVGTAGGLVRTRQLRAGPGSTSELMAGLRTHGPAGPGHRVGAWCRHGPQGTAAAMLATLGGGEGTACWFCVGPSCCGVFLRQWPGLLAGPEASAGPGGVTETVSDAALLGARLGEAVVDDPSLLPRLRAALDGVERAALHEGDEAERQARLMERDGDERGGWVRRALAVAYAGEMAVSAQRRLLAELPRRGAHRDASL